MDIEALFEQLLSGDWDESEAALAALRGGGPAVDGELRRRLDPASPNRAAQAQLLELLAQRPSVGAGLARAVEPFLRHPHAGLRRRASQAWARIDAAASSPAALREALQDEDPRVREAAARALGEGVLDDAAWSALIAALSDSDAGVRGAARGAVASLGEPAAQRILEAIEAGSGPPGSLLEALAPFATLPDAQARLLRALSAEDEATRRGAAAALGRAGRSVTEVLGRLVRASQASPQRRGAMRAMASVIREGGLGEDAGELARCAAAALRSEADWEDAAALLEALGPAAYETLASAFESADGPLQVRILRCLDGARSDARQLLPKLLRGFEGQDPRLREELARGLAAMGPGLYGPIAAALSDPREAVRVGCAATLRMAAQGLEEDPRGPAAMRLQQLLPQLIAGLERAELVSELVGAIARLGRAAAELLVAGLDAAAPATRLARLRALEALGSAGAEFAGRLSPYLAVEDDALRRAARDAVVAAGPEAFTRLLPSLQQSANLGPLLEVARRLGPAVAPGLLEALPDLPPRGRARTLRLLGALLAREPRRSAVTQRLDTRLLRSLVDEHPLLRQAAAEALAALAPSAARDPDRAARLAQALEAAAGHPDPSTRRPALGALSSLGSAGLEPLVRVLLSSDGAVRLDAATAFSRLGEDAADILAAALEHPEPGARSIAARILGRLRLEPEVRRRVVSALTVAVEDPAARHTALFALGEQSEGQPEAIATLVEVLSAADAASLWWALLALTRSVRRSPRVARPELLAATAPALFRLVVDPRAEVQARATDALAAFSPDALLFLPELWEAWRKAPSAEARRQLTRLARRFGAGALRPWSERLSSRRRLRRDLAEAGFEEVAHSEDDRERMSALREAFQGDCGERRRLAIAGVSLCAEAPQSDLAALAEMLADPDPVAAALARVSLEAFGRGAFPTLLSGLESPHALIALARISSKRKLREPHTATTRQVARALRKRLEDEDLAPAARIFTLRAIGSLGVERDAALACLGRALETPLTRAAACDALRAVGTPAVAPLLEELDRPRRRHGALTALRAIVDEAGPAPLVETLSGALSSESPTQRRDAATLLAGSLSEAVSEEDSRNLIPAVQRALEDRDTELRKSALLALSSNRVLSKSQSSGLLPSVREALDDAAGHVRAVASEALGALAEGDPQALDALAQTPSSEDTLVREGAAWALGEQLRRGGAESEGQAVAARLRELLSDPRPEVRTAAARGLEAAPSSLATSLALTRRALEDPDPVTRWESCWAQRATIEDALGDLISALEDPASGAVEAVTGAGWIGLKAAEARVDDPRLARAVRATLADAATALAARAKPAGADGLLRRARALGSRALADIEEALPTASGQELELGLRAAMAAEPHCLWSALDHPRAELRAVAARLLASERGLACPEEPWVIDRLVELLEGERLELARWAAIIAARLDPRRVTPPLSAALRRFAQVGERRDLEAALESLAALSSGLAAADRGAAIPLAVEALGSPSAALREVAARACAALCEELPTRLEGPLASPRRELRAAALAALANAPEAPAHRAALEAAASSAAAPVAVEGLLQLGDARSQEALRSILSDGGLQARRAVVDALLRGEPDEAGDALLAAALDAGPEELAARAAEGLGRRRSARPTSLEALRRALRQGRAVREVLGAVSSLGEAARSLAAEVAALLGSEDEATRRAACEAIGALGASAGRAQVAALSARLLDTAPAVRMAAARALSEWGREAASCAAATSQLLLDPSARVAAAGAEALAWLDPDGGLGAEALILACQSDSARLRGAALEALSRILPGLPDEDRWRAFEALDGPVSDEDDGGARIARLRALAAAAPLPGSRAIVRGQALALQRARPTDAPALRRASFRLLGAIRDGSPTVCLELLEALEAEAAEVASAAASALGELRMSDEGLREQVCAALREAASQPGALGDAAILALGGLLSQAPSPSSLELLARRLRADDPGQRRSAARALAAARRIDGAASAALGEALASGDRRLALAALHALVAQGGLPVSAQGAVIEAAMSGDESLRRAALHALRRAPGDREALGVELAGALSRAPRELRGDLTELLAELPLTATSSRALQDALQDGEQGVRSAALRGFAALGAESEGAVEAICRCARRGTREDRSLALEALSRIGARAARPARPLLRQALADPDLRASAMAALTRFGPSARRLLPELISASRSATSRVLDALDAALVAVGPPADPDIPLILPLLRAEDAATRLRALRCLARRRDRSASLAVHLLSRLGDEDRAVATEAQLIVGRGLEVSAAQSADLVALLDQGSRALQEIVFALLERLTSSTLEAQRAAERLIEGGHPLAAELRELLARWRGA